MHALSPIKITLALTITFSLPLFCMRPEDSIIPSLQEIKNSQEPIIIRFRPQGGYFTPSKKDFSHWQNYFQSFGMTINTNEKIIAINHVLEIKKDICKINSEDIIKQLATLSFIPLNKITLTNDSTITYTAQVKLNDTITPIKIQYLNHQYRSIEYYQPHEQLLAYDAITNTKHKLSIEEAKKLSKKWNSQTTPPTTLLVQNNNPLAIKATITIAQGKHAVSFTGLSHNDKNQLRECGFNIDKNDTDIGFIPVTIETSENNKIQNIQYLPARIFMTDDKTKTILTSSPSGPIYEWNTDKCQYQEINQLISSLQDHPQLQAPISTKQNNITIPAKETIQAYVQITGDPIIKLSDLSAYQAEQIAVQLSHNGFINIAHDEPLVPVNIISNLQEQFGCYLPLSVFIDDEKILEPQRNEQFFITDTNNRTYEYFFNGVDGNQSLTKMVETFNGKNNEKNKEEKKGENVGTIDQPNNVNILSFITTKNIFASLLVFTLGSGILLLLKQMKK